MRRRLGGFWGGGVGYTILPDATDTERRRAIDAAEARAESEHERLDAIPVLATEVDASSAYVGASAACVDALLSHPALGAMTADAHAPSA